MPATGIPKGSSFGYETGIRVLEAQSRRIDALDSKAGILLAVDGVLAGLAFGSNDGHPKFAAAIAFISALTLLTSFLLALLAFRVRQYATAPSLGRVIQTMTRDEPWLKWRFLGNLQEAEATNSRKLALKAKLFHLSLVFLLVSVYNSRLPPRVPRRVFPPGYPAVVRTGRARPSDPAVWGHQAADPSAAGTPSGPTPAADCGESG
ncbi:MAG: hypothetical protein ACR2M4_11310 [Actinomycetota bacterium]